MKLFVWDDYAPDYTSGLAFAVAENSEQARDMIADSAGYRSDSLCEKPKVYDLNELIVFQCSGGS